MTNQPTGKEAYEARRRFQKETKVRKGLPKPQDTARRLSATALWAILIIGWLTAFSEALAVALGVSWDWTPKVTIEAEANHFENNPIGTEFRVTNAGRVALHNVHFECVIDKGPNGRGGHLRDNSPGQEPLATFEAGAEATRNCGTFMLGIPNAKTLDFSVSYEWAFNKSPDPAEKHFVIRRGQRGEFYAVPDQQDRRP